jgi:hypothetical protein
MSQLLGLGLVILAALLLLALTLIKRKSPRVFRKIAAFTRLQRAAGLAVEDGTRLHVSLGRGGLLTPRGAAALSGLSLLRQLGEQNSISDRPPIATSGDAVLAVLSQDTLQAAYQSAGAEELFQPANGRLGGLTPFSYAAAAMTVTHQEQVSTDVLIGDFGSEVALIADAAEREPPTTWPRKPSCSLRLRNRWWARNSSRRPLILETPPHIAPACKCRISCAG